MQSMKLVILDRDGVINHDSDSFIRSPEEWLPIRGSLEAIARLTRAEYRVIVATNQSGVGRGLLDMATLNRIHARMIDHVRHKGGSIDAIFFSPHAAETDSEDRKPRPGMFRDIASRLKVNLTGVPAVGDSLRDLQAAHAVNALPVLVRTGKGLRTEASIRQEEGLEGLRDVPVFDDLGAFVDAFLAGQLSGRIESLKQGAPDDAQVPG